MPDIPDPGVVVLHGCAEPLEGLRVLGGGGAYWRVLTGQPQQEHGEQVLEDGRTVTPGRPEERYSSATWSSAWRRTSAPPADLEYRRYEGAGHRGVLAASFDDAVDLADRLRERR